MGLIPVETCELTKSFPCKAFYDNDNDQLSVGIKRAGKFHSYVEAGYFSFDITPNGKLLNIDVWKPRKEWVVTKEIAPPDEFEKKDLVFLKLRQKIDPVDYFTDREGSLLYIRFTKKRINSFVSPANSLIFELDKDDQLVGLWITEIEQDFSFRKEAIWRRSVKAPQSG